MIQIKLQTPYTAIVSNYFLADFDIIGIYYSDSSNSGKVELLLYDVYTSERIYGISFIGELLLWESVKEFNTTKFYSNTEEVEIAESIASLLFTLTVEREDSLRDLILAQDYQPKICTSLMQRIQRLNIQESACSTYQRTCQGIACAALDEFYEDLHTSFFTVLRKLNYEGYTIFPQKVNYCTSFEKDKDVVRKVRVCIQEKVLRLNREDVNLGEESFVLPIILDYHPETNEGKMQLSCKNFNILFMNGHGDFSFMDKKTLLEVLKYIEFSDSSFVELEKKIVYELALRSDCIPMP